MARAKRRRVGESAGPREGAKVKKTVSLTIETARRLGVHAKMTGRTDSDVAESILSAGLRRFRVQDHGGPGAEAGGSDPAG